MESWAASLGGHQVGQAPPTFSQTHWSHFPPTLAETEEAQILPLASGASIPFQGDIARALRKAKTLESEFPQTGFVKSLLTQSVKTKRRAQVFCVFFFFKDSLENPRNQEPAIWKSALRGAAREPHWIF